MYFLDLPVEIGTLILQYLDTKSKFKVYNTCSEIRKYFAPCLVKKVVLARSCLGTSKTLQTELLCDQAHNIQELDLSGVPDLTANELQPLVNQLTSLKTLDVTFTGIYIDDLLEICPENLKNIGVNFFKCPQRSRRDNVWDICRNFFKSKHFTSIHFVVFEFLDSDTPLIFLKDLPKTEDLRVTVADNYRDFWEVEDQHFSPKIRSMDINFSNLYYIYRDCRVTHKNSQHLKGVFDLNFKEIEYIFIMYLEKIVIYVSPIFRTLFTVNCSDLTIGVCECLPSGFLLDGNIVFKAWNKSTTEFNDNFFQQVLDEMKFYFPTYVCLHNNTKMKIVKAASDWYCIDACEGFEKVFEDLPEIITLTDFCRKDGAVLRCNKPISLTPGSVSLRNITFIRLSNICLRDDFFIILFGECLKLHTLDVYVEKRTRMLMGQVREWTMSLSNAIHLAENLKNIKVTSEDIEYMILFDALSRCRTLENVHICEYERILGDNDIAVNSILFFIERCVNLYSLFIEADMSPETLTLLMSPLRERAQRLERDHLCIEVCDCYRGWNPFADVFNPSPLHILD